MGGGRKRSTRKFPFRWCRYVRPQICRRPRLCVSLLDPPLRTRRRLGTTPHHITSQLTFSSRAGTKKKLYGWTATTSNSIITLSFHKKILDEKLKSTETHS